MDSAEVCIFDRMATLKGEAFQRYFVLDVVFQQVVPLVFIRLAVVCGHQLYRLGRGGTTC